jgi:drug/metabolite transporter (DMT)-like permease
VLAVAALSLAGSLAFPLFAFGQARVPAELAGAFVNLEPVVGVAAGWIAFGDSAAIGQLFGAAAVLLGIALSTVPPEDWARWTTRWQLRLPDGLRVLTGQRWQ